MLVLGMGQSNRHLKTACINVHLFLSPEKQTEERERENQKSGVILEKLRATQLVQKFPALYGT
jgi:hypothetical protein